MLSIYDVIFSVLPVETFLKDFVSNKKDCNYEYFLVEMLNTSAYFRFKSLDCEYKHVDKQDKSEPDAISKFYDLDFKLVGDENMFEAYRNTSRRMEEIYPGLRIDQPPRNFEKIYGFYNLRVLSRMMNNSSSSHKYNNGNNQIFEEESVISQFLKILDTKKNLMLFYPYDVKIKKTIDVLTINQEIGDYIYNDFKTVFDYRIQHCLNYDTYFVLLYMNNFIIFSLYDDCLIYVDEVSMNKCPTFIKYYYWK